MTATVAAELIDAGPNDRQTFDTAGLEELAASILAHGLAQPPTLRPVAGGRFEIVAGERRCRAMRDVLGWAEIPAIVRELSDEAASAIMLVENVQRTDLDPLEEAAGYRSRIERFGYTVAEVATLASVPASRVRGRLALLALSPAVAHYVSTRQLPLSFAGCMTSLDSNRQMIALQAHQSSPITLEAFRALCAKLQGEQDQDSMFDPASFLRVEEYVLAAELEVAPAPVEIVRERVLGAHEAAATLGVKRATVHQWIYRKVFPAADMAVGAQPAWFASTVTAWAESTGRAVA